jgi:RNA polymerase sigma-70 factor (ECF subfamily)
MYHKRVGKNQTEDTDEEIALLVQSGDKEKFGLLIDRFETKLIRYGKKFLARTEDIEDIVQDIFTSAYQNIQSFNPSQKFSPWIYRIAHNAFVNAIKKNSKNPLVLFDFDTLASHLTYDDPKEDEQEKEDIKEMVDKGMNKLSAKYREILTLYYFEEMSYKEIADILEVPTGTVGIRLKRAKQALKETYKKTNI